MRDHTKLRAFQLADEVALMIYRITRNFPEEEIYGLTAQLRRAVVSMPSNIVEVCARESRVEYLRFLQIAFGSLKKAHYQLPLAFRLGYAGQPDFSEWEVKLNEGEKVLASLIRSLRTTV